MNAMIMQLTQFARRKVSFLKKASTNPTVLASSDDEFVSRRIILFAATEFFCVV